tara:strand:- start:15579 stop:18644 length:3066 start_codon:yes stop_codon:yes gene_type:complete
MTRNSRELSQFASFVEVRDANQNIGLTTSLVMLGGVGIGSTVGDYLTERTSRGSSADDSLINFNESYLLDDVYIEGRLNVDDGSTAAITGFGATFPKLNVGGLTTTRDLVVTGVTTLSRDTGMGTVYIGQPSVPVANAQGGDPSSGNADFGLSPVGPGGGAYADSDSVAHALVVIDNVGSDDPKESALYVAGRVHFNGTDPVISGQPGLGTEFVVVPGSIFYDTATFMEGVDVVPAEGASVRPTLRVLSPEFENDPGIGYTDNFGLPAIYTSGGLQVDCNLGVGKSTKIDGSISVGSSIDYSNPIGASENTFFNNTAFRVPEVYVGIDSGDKRFVDGSAAANGNRTSINFGTSTLTDLLPKIADGRPHAFIGSESGRWENGFFHFLDIGPAGTDSQVNMVNLDVGLGATIAYLSVAGAGGTDENEVYLNVGPGKAVFANVDSTGFFNHVGVATINGFLNIISSSYNNAFVSTAFQANNVDLYKQDETNSTNPEFFYPAMGNSGQNQTDAGGRLFVNPGFYLDAFSTSLFVHNNLNVLGTAINADESGVDLRFDLLNYGVKELNLASEARYIDIGEAQSSDGGFTSIRSNVTELTRLRLSQNDIQAAAGQTAISLVDDTYVAIAGWVQIGGTYIKCDQNDINIADTSLRADLFKSATDVVIGGNDLGIATLRNNITELTGFLRLGKNVIQSDDGTTAITVGTAGTYVETTGDLIVGGNDIQTGFGVTNIELVGDTKTIFYGDIEIRGNEILSSDGAVNILMLDNQELTSFTGPIRVEGNEVQAGTGDTNITLVANNNTIFAGAIQVGSDEIRASNGQANITMDSDVKTTVAGDLQVGTGTMRAGDGTIAIKMEGGTGNVGITSDLTANSVFFNGSEARLNVQDVNIRDNLLTLGLIEDPLNEGTLIPPNVAAGNTGDAGILMARYDVGLSTHRYAGIFYDQSEGRVAIRTDVNPNPGTGEVGRDRYVLPQGLPSEMELQNLYININNTLGLTTIFEANTVDTGVEIKEVLNVVNVEIDAGLY